VPLNLFLPLETKHITCELQNQTTCLEWEERKESSAELAVTDYMRQDYLYEACNDYCNTWGCIGIGLEMCKSHEWDCGTSHTIGKSFTFTDDCCGRRCIKDNGCHNLQYPKRKRDEIQDCICTKTAVYKTVGNTFCQEWECLDFSSTKGYSYKEYETHTCSERNSIFGYCQKWDWHTDDYDSFENTKCNCMETMISGTDIACQRFECMEKGAEKISPYLVCAIIENVFAVSFAAWSLYYREEEGFWHNLFSVLCLPSVMYTCCVGIVLFF
jgi:hypothetical protein